MPKARKTRARRDEDKQKRRHDILDAAERVLEKHGLAKATFGRIAKQSRLSRGLIYVYFPTREDLIFGICERGLQALGRRFDEAAAAHPSGLDQVIAMGRAYRAFSGEEPLYFQVISNMETQHLAPDDMTETERVAMDCGRSVIGRVAASVVQGVKDGSISPDTGDPVLTALSMWSFTHGLIQVSSRKGDLLEQKFELSGEQLVEHGFQTLRAALASSKARRK